MMPIVWLIDLVMDGLVMLGQFSNELGTVVRHCILVFCPHAVRPLFYLLAEVVLSEVAVELRSVMFRPEVGVRIVKTSNFELIGRLLRLFILIPWLIDCLLLSLGLLLMFLCL